MNNKFLEVIFYPKDIINKYKPLKKITVPLKYEIVFYPYYFVKKKAVVNSFIFKNKYVQENRVVDMIKGSVLSVVGDPKFDENKTEKNDTYPYTILPSKINDKESLCLATDNVTLFLQKKIGGPFKSKLDIIFEEDNGYGFFRPFWVVHAENVNNEDQMMIVDAVTGLAGGLEAAVIKKYWLNLKNNC